MFSHMVHLVEIIKVLQGSSEVEFVIFLADKNTNSALTDFSIVKSRTLIRSVLGVQTFSLADSCEAAIPIRHELKNITIRTFKIKILTYKYEILFNVIIHNASTTESILMIDVKASREAYNDGIVEDSIWIRRSYNLTNVMTKTSILAQLLDVIETGNIEYEIEQSFK